MKRFSCDGILSGLNADAMSAHASMCSMRVFGAFLMLLAVTSPGNASAEPVQEKQASRRPLRIEQGKNIELDEGTVQCIAFSPDNKLIAVGADRTLHVFDVKRSEWSHRLQGHTDHISAVAFSPDGQLLAMGSRDATIRLWETASGTLLKVLTREKDDLSFPRDAPIACVAFFPDGKRLASCGTNNYVTFWDLASGL